MTTSSLLDSETAAARLKVSRATLYAYVSRGFIRTHAEASDPRRRLYSADDVERLVVRKARGRKSDTIAETTLDWGLPVLSSRITLIRDGRLFYRGRDAVRLAETASLEETASLLWECDDACFGPTVLSSPAWTTLAAAITHRAPVERCMALVPLAEAAGLSTEQRDRTHLLASAANLLRHVAAGASGGHPNAAPIHESLAESWGVGTADANLIRKMLVLSADHELNPSTFAVRVVASTGASLAHCIGAGLAALSGPRHGGATRRIEALFDEIERTGDAERAIAGRLSRGEMVPGCGHQLYPGGDPRARALLEPLPADRFGEALLAALEHNGVPPSDGDALLAALARTGVPAPNIDMALVLLTRRLGLPVGSAAALFAIGRTVGWIAHALEQVADGRLIRPRARYIGVAPEA